MQLSQDELRSQIKSGPKGPYLFWGSEEYLKNFYQARIKVHTLQGAEDFAEWNTREIDASPSDFHLDDLEEALSTVPMMADKVFVTYRSTFKAPKEKEDKKGDKKAKTKKDGFMEEVEKFLALVEDCDTATVCLVVIITSQGEDDNRALSSLIKKFDSTFSCVKLDPPTPAEIDAWIERRMKRENLTMSLDAKLYYKERASLGMFQLTGEIEKISCYAKANDKTLIDMAMVGEISSLTDISENFAMSNAIVNGDRRAALRELYLSKQRLEPVQMIIGTVISNVTAMLNIKSLMNEGLTKDEIAQKTKMHAFRVSKLMDGVRYVDYEKILAAQKRLYEADTLRKTANLDDYLVLERFICTLPVNKK